MNRIEQIFADLRTRGGRALMPFLTAGDPDLETTAALLPALQAAGACICELGVPFSDPLADGPVIQASMAHALGSGLRPAQILEMTARERPHLDLGLVLMVSYTIVHRLGEAAFCRQAHQGGIDGLIVPDLTIEAADTLRQRAADEGIVCSFLIAPTTPLERAERIVRASTGFVYVLARAGITGERSHLPESLPARIRRLRDLTGLPIAVGFGISDPAQVRAVVQYADAAIVGSAIMRRIAEHRGEERSKLVERVKDFTKDLAGGLTNCSA